MGDDIKVLSLDFLLEPVKPVGYVELLGETYELMSADLMENFLTLVAMSERVSADAKLESAGDNLPGQMEELRESLRSMIRVMVPDLPEKLLKEKFPKMGQLQKLFSLLLIEVTKTLPESVKKNSGETMTTEKTAAS